MTTTLRAPDGFSKVTTFADQTIDALKAIGWKEVTDKSFLYSREVAEHLYKLHSYIMSQVYLMEAINSNLFNSSEMKRYADEVIELANRLHEAKVTIHA